MIPESGWAEWRIQEEKEEEEAVGNRGTLDQAESISQSASWAERRLQGNVVEVWRIMENVAAFSTLLETNHLSQFVVWVGQTLLS